MEKLEKKRRLNANEESKLETKVEIDQRVSSYVFIIHKVFIKLKDSEGNELMNKLEISLNTPVEVLSEMINKLLANEENTPYSFFFETL